MNGTGLAFRDEDRADMAGHERFFNVAAVTLASCLDADCAPDEPHRMVIEAAVREARARLRALRGGQR